MDEAELKRWAAALREVGEPVVGGDDRTRPFVDEMGHRRAVDGAFLAWCGRAPVGERDAGGIEGGMPGGRGGRARLDVALWKGLWLARTERAAFDDLLSLVAMKGTGPLTELREFSGIEVWTETELSALHALSWVAIETGSREVWARMMDAAAWHVGEMQPDNATGHPWALHVFLWLERERAGIGGREHAATLLSNCQVGMGRVDLFGAYVLMDGARALESEW